MNNLPIEFVERMRNLLGDGADDFFAVYNAPAARGIRANTLKITKEELTKILPFAPDGDVPWEPSGFYVCGENLGRTVYHAAGLYYVQEPSAMSVAPFLDVKKGERVLDLCSAPGGKGTKLAEYLAGSGLIVMNEPDAKRYAALCANVERMGIKNAVLTCADPDSLARILPDYFDKILVDAPCSGEGMFRKEEAAVREWSLNNVLYCALRQRKILESADRMLRGGGTLVYSTCTFAPEEDERQVESFLKDFPAYELVKTNKLYPHKIRGEGHFYAVLRKKSGDFGEIKEFSDCGRGREIKIYREWESATLTRPRENVYSDGGYVFALPDGVPQSLVGRGIKAKCGVLLGKVTPDNKRFEPAHPLAMSLKSTEARCVEVDYDTALNYLKGLTFDCGANDGWYVVTHLGYPLGWSKAVNGTAKNHFPKGLRI